jgi:hypothetical protein
MTPISQKDVVGWKIYHKQQWKTSGKTQLSTNKQNGRIKDGEIYMTPKEIDDR